MNWFIWKEWFIFIFGWSSISLFGLHSIDHFQVSDRRFPCVISFENHISWPFFINGKNEIIDRPPHPYFIPSHAPCWVRKKAYLLSKVTCSYFARAYEALTLTHYRLGYPSLCRAFWVWVSWVNQQIMRKILKELPKVPRSYEVIFYSDILI